MGANALPIASQPPRQAPLWRVAQWTALVATPGVAVAALLWPVVVMSLVWNVVVPVLPLSFLVTPVLWRGVCPLATLNMLGNRPGGLKLSGRVARWAGCPGMIALAAIVPLRHAGLNDSPVALVLLLTVAGGAAWWLGRRYDARAGFCNLVCPVLPVERLYGQNGLIDIGNPRCTSCSVCTPRGCPDLAMEKTLPQLMGPFRRTEDWLRTATGAFACGFPGFVLGYFMVPAGSSLGVSYLWILGGTVVFCVVTSAVVWLTGVGSRVALPSLAALAIAIYYWNAIPGMLRVFGVTAFAPVTTGRLAVFGFVGWWLLRALAGGRLTRRR
jgi:hypothetical protein